MKKGISFSMFLVFGAIALQAQKWYVEPAYNRTFQDNNSNPYGSYYRVGYMLNVNVGVQINKSTVSKFSQYLYGGLFYSDVHYEIDNDHPRLSNSSYWGCNAFRGGLAFGTSIKRYMGLKRRCAVGIGMELNIPLIIKGKGYSEVSYYYSNGGTFTSYFKINRWNLDTTKTVAHAQVFLPISLNYKFRTTKKTNWAISYQYLLSLTSDLKSSYPFNTNYHRVALRFGFL